MPLWPVEPVLHTIVVQYLIAFCSQIEATSDVISGAIGGQVGMDVRVKFSDSSSNGSRDIRLPHFMTNDDHAGHHICQKITANELALTATVSLSHDRGDTPSPIS